MKRAVEFNGEEFDVVDQKILVELDDTDGEPLGPTEIGNRISEDRQLVWNRLNYSLADADVTQRIAQGEYTLTVAGRFFVDVHRDELARPASFTEISKGVQEAKRDASSAKESVQGYRTKVSRIEDDAEEAAEKVDEIEDEAVTQEKLEQARIELQNEILQSIDARVERILRTLGDPSELREETVIDELHAIHATLGYMQKYQDRTWDSAQQHCTQNEEQIEELQGKVADVEGDLIRLESDIEADDGGGLFDFRR